jgi:roadblock/LC7 domain-containing protein
MRTKTFRKDQPYIRIDENDETGEFVGKPYYIKDGKRVEVVPGDVLDVYASTGDWGYSTYQEFTVQSISKASIACGSRDRYSRTQKRVNFTKIAEGANPNVMDAWGTTFGHPVYLERTAAEKAAADKRQREARDAESKRQNREYSARNLAATGYERESAVKTALSEAKFAAREAILIKYATEVAALEATMGAEAVATVNAEHPEVEVFVVTYGGLSNSGWGSVNSYAFATEDEALEFVGDSGKASEEITIAGPVVL